MEFETLLRLVGEDPVFESSLLLAGDVDPKLIRLQLTRWVKSGRIYQIRRGLYAIAPPYRKTVPHPFLMANHIQRASYVSLQSALAYHGLIPETVMVTTSVTTGRPETLTAPLGVFEFRHVKTGLFFGYRMFDLGGQAALIATPEKALLDLIYLQPGGGSPAYIAELRLQNTGSLDVNLLRRTAGRFNSPKLLKALQVLVNILWEDTHVYEEV